ncbi:hypothetical protein O7599_24270 [Streptomyces sp. WMMC500]|uniref:hypothetical protein n=1 Tax=Streptomyces sp. WMMC500 TaxID=3015154 RepID=UPI00248ACF1C|nr:hypothetical protein [Streptomyces sp. WMMC500]WBB58723.1 hypothetical protein O7599_24270 [Streptomyces sp. WMMC500]
MSEDVVFAASRSPGPPLATLLLSLVLVAIGGGVAWNFFGVPEKIFEKLSGRSAVDPKVPFGGSFRFQRLAGAFMAIGGSVGVISSVVRMI